MKENTVQVATVKLPVPSSMLVINLLGVAALVGLAVAVGGLTGNWWWSLLVASVEGLFVACVATVNQVRADSGEDLVAVRPRAA